MAGFFSRFSSSRRTEQPDSGPDLVVHATAASFDDEVLLSDTLVLVDFWATWCGPCKAIAPVLKKAAQSYEGRLKIVKVDIDHHQQVAVQFGIRNIPTLLLFKNGEVVGTHVGSLNRGRLDRFVAAHL